MEQHESIKDEIEDSLRICDEIFNDNPEFVTKRPDDLDDIILNQNLFTPEQKEPEPKNEPEPKIELELELKQPELKQPELEQPEPEQRTSTKDIEPMDIVQEKAQITFEPANEETNKIQESDDNGEEDETENKRGLRTIISIIICVIIAVGVAALITKFVANHTTVEGGSMEPCLVDGDQLIVEKMSYMTGSPKRYDIIVFQYDENTKYIKRVIGLPGEKIKIEEGIIYINGRAMFDKYGNQQMEDGGIAEKTITLGSDEYFVLGDNRNSSKDSRNKSVGPIKTDKILGRAWFRVLPFSSMGSIE